MSCGIYIVGYIILIVGLALGAHLSNMLATFDPAKAVARVKKAGR